MSIYSEMQKAQLSYRKEYSKTKDINFKYRANILNLVISRLSPGGNAEPNENDNVATAIIREYMEANKDIINNSPSLDVEVVKATEENQVLSLFIPEQYTQDQLEHIIKTYVEDNNLAGNKANIRIVQGYLKDNHAGRFNPKDSGKLTSKYI